ncbi:MAG: diguanylate cyclase response regulator [Syntrophus sp. (in: bacteria)]|nr:diguanylate cyclase response regulator [Syntrophus sp. (in: bacteria)]
MSKLLLVDDDKILGRVVSKTLWKTLGVNLEVVYSMEEAKFLIDNCKDEFYLAILDYNLPDAPDGQIVDYILSKNIPALVLTGSYDNDIRDKMLSKNIVDYIVKRSTKELEYLVSVVNRIINNRYIKALVVDDSSTYRLSMSNILKNQLLNVFSAENGKEAQDVIIDNPDIKIVITDYIMPYVDGLDLLTHIRERYKKDTMAVIIASGVSGVDIVPKFLKAGANDYIMKPFSIEEFICRVNLNLENLSMIETLRGLAHKDSLTGLHNRRHLFEAGSAVYSSAQRNNFGVAVMMMDINEFKKINDHYGHDAGDQVLRNCADRLRKLFNRKSDIVSRVGGDEFCVITSFENEEGLCSFAEEARKNIEEEKVECDGNTIGFTISIGICTRQLNSLEAMIKNADNMMYKAKKTGKNVMCSDD